MAASGADPVAMTSDQESFCPDRTNLTEPTIAEPSELVAWIQNYYNEDLDSMDAGDIVKRYDLVAEWDDWCELKYRGTDVRDWDDRALAAGVDVDIRLLTKAQTIAGHAILRFLEACYSVDKALCGADTEALAQVRLWHIPLEMSAYKYLLSEEMMMWWATELATLETEINSPCSSQVLLSWRIRDLSASLEKLEDAMEIGDDVIGTAIWTTISESRGDGSGIPAGSLVQSTVELSD
ncbi:hypothetical protein DL98DRAFT_624838 [Cadophora sp. DSE1049]|nr:hypothetical protein DL98DRAFT_624838 [Cadophora sp. DSE1049]